MTEELLEPVEGAGEELPPIEQAQEQPPQEPETSPESMEEARKYGWRPKEEFDLDPEGWVDADRFLELPSTQRKQLRDTNRELTSKIQKLEQSSETAMKEAARAAKLAADQQQRRHEDEMAQLRQSQRKAAQEGDMETYDQLERKSQDLAQKAPQPEQQQQPQQRSPEFQKHMQTADWTKDPTLLNAGKVAIDQAPAIIKATWSSDLDQLLYAEAELKKHFPDKFEQPKPRTPRVDGGGIGAPRAKKGFNALPPEAQRAAREFVEQKLFDSVDDYAKAYFEGDE